MRTKMNWNQNFMSSVTLTIFIIKTVHANAINYTYAQSLMKDLLTNYDPTIRPVYEERINISVGYYLFSIKDFDEKSGTLFSVGGPFYIWRDSRLSWDRAEYGNLTNLPFKSPQIWYPELYLLNPANKMEPIGDPSFFPRAIFDGSVWRYVSSILKTSCHVDMTYFPFDTQVCNIEIVAWGYSYEELYLVNITNIVDLTYFQENSQWEVQSAVLKQHTLKNIEGMVAAVISMKRRPTYYVVNIICPIFMLCILNPLVFLLPTESGERISYTITIFLSLAVFMTLISDNMPKSSEPMSRLSYILLVTMAYSTVLCIASIYIMRVHFRPKSRPIPSRMKKLISILQCRCLSVCRRRKSTEEVVTSSKVIDISKVPSISYTDDDKEMRKDDTTWVDIASAMDKIGFLYSCVFLVALIAMLFLSLLV